MVLHDKEIVTLVGSVQLFSQLTGVVWSPSLGLCDYHQHILVLEIKTIYPGPYVGVRFCVCEFFELYLAIQHGLSGVGTGRIVGKHRVWHLYKFFYPTYHVLCGTSRWTVLLL